MNANLIIGLFWLLFFFLGMLFKERTYWTDYGWLLVSGFYLGTYLYQNRHGYLTLENGMLKINDPRNKHINLKEVTRFKYFAGDFILQSETQKLKINTHYLDEASLELLKTELAKYGLQQGTIRKVQVESNQPLQPPSTINQ
ncbi:MAG: hypothetical protein KJP14_12665 [Eudoraea sp.]|nr:hypothetical protein [Eudoraea sp.]MBT8223397.1 hypothetical protein [Eudoraea sp.]